MKLIALLASVLLGQIADNINNQTLDYEKDPSRVETLMQVSENGTNALVYLLELFFKTPVTSSEVSGILALQSADGSFRDIDYADTAPSQCSQTWHAVRFRRLAVYHKLHPRDKAVKKALHLALEYWGRTMPKTASWYYNQVNIPKTFGEGLLLVKDELSRKELLYASAIMHQAQLNRNGQNLVWEAGNLLIAGLLDQDETLVRDMAARIQGEINSSASSAGIQPDWSFFQHGAQLQFGNYGLSFAVSQAFWSKALAGTSLALPPDKEAILKDYICKGIGRTVWGGYMDHNALGRQIFPGSQKAKALCLSYAMEAMGVSEDDIENGPRYYSRADFANYRANGWYASLRMQSARTQGYEELNGENQKGYFSADGVLLVRQSGGEYDDLAPVWDWRRLPGTTTYDDGTPLWGTHNQLPYNKSHRVFGETFGDLMFAAMEYDRDGVKARKIWAFAPEGILCMGSGISGPKGAETVTTVEQVRAAGPVAKGKDWVSHNGVSYVSLGGKAFSQAGVIERHGNWTLASPKYPEDDVCEKLFEVCYSHGTEPSGEGYAFFIGPRMEGPEAAAYSASSIRILSDHSAKIGAVQFTVDWEQCKILIYDNMIDESPNYKIGNTTPVINLKPGLQRQILGYNDNLMLVKVIFGEEMVGQRPPLHTHHQTQSSYIVSGKFEFHLGDNEGVILGAGDSFYVEPDTPHEAWCLEPGIIIDAFNPIREDFLNLGDKVMARPVPGHFDDFVFENNLIAGRFFGKGQEGNPTSPGLDIWVKKPGKLVAEDWYAAQEHYPGFYHYNHGGKDCYSVGVSLGGGASVPFIDGKLCYPATNYRSCAILSQDKERVCFQLDYPTWEAAPGIRVKLRKIIVLDADCHYASVEDTYTFTGADQLTIAAGFRLHSPADTMALSDRIAIWEEASDQRVEPEDGMIGLAVSMEEAEKAYIDSELEHALLLKTIRSGESVRYRMGSCWSKGTVNTPEAWFSLVKCVF